MKIAIGSDHRGFSLKEDLKDALQELKIIENEIIISYKYFV